MRAYFSVFRMRLKMELQYRGAMIGGIVCQMFFGIVLVALYHALYESKAQAMPIEQVSTYVWLQQAFFRMMVATDPDLNDKIKNGSISYDLCRPVNMYTFYYIRVLQAFQRADIHSPAGTVMRLTQRYGMQTIRLRQILPYMLSGRRTQYLMFLPHLLRHLPQHLRLPQHLHLPRHLLLLPLRLRIPSPQRKQLQALSS